MSILFQVIGGLLLVGAIIWVSLQKRRTSGPKKAKETRQMRLERSVWAWAQVVSSSRSEPGPGGMVRVTLELEVHMPGTSPYTVHTTWLVEQDALEYVETGKEVSLKVDPLGPEHVYPNGPWATPVEEK